MDGKNIVDKVLSELLSAGADKAGCRVTLGVVDELNVDGGKFSLLRSVFNQSVSMRVIKDSRQGTISINKTDNESIKAAAELCVQNALASAQDDAEQISELEENLDFTSGVLECDKDRFFDRINEYAEDIKKDYPEIFIEQLIACYGKKKSFFGNTNGVRFTNESGYYSVSSMYSAQADGKTTGFNETGVDFTDLDKRIIDLGSQRRMYEQCVKELDSVPFDGKFTGKVVIAPSCLSDIVCTAVDLFTSDGSLIDGTSPWKDSLNKQVASESLTVKLIPIDDRVVGGERFTPDGYKTENCTVIENGVLKSFTLSDYGARKTGQTRCSTLSGCTEVVSGDKTLDEIISDIDLGLYVCRMSGGEPAGNGDFSAVAKNSFLIEHGKITRAVTQTMISGNLDKMMKNVAAVSKETVEDGTDVFPWVCFDTVTVSGG